MRSLLLFLACVGIAAAQTPTPTPVNLGPPSIFVDVVPDPILDGSWVVCSAKDDNPVHYAWSKVSGPVGGVAQFANPGARSTHVSFTLPGLYVLRCTVNDGLYFVHDEIAIAATTAFADSAAKVK